MSEYNDFFKNAKNIREDNDTESMDEEIDTESRDEDSDDLKKNMFGSFDYNQFMNQSSSEYMMYSTMDIIKTMNIMTELRQLFDSLGDWDRIVLFYAYELMQRNMQVVYKLGLYLFKNQNEDLVSQMIYWGLLLFCLSNVQTAYSYLIYRVYKLDKAFARKLHEFLKEQFMFFDNTKDMSGVFNNIVPNRLDHPQESRNERYGDTANVS